VSSYLSCKQKTCRGRFILVKSGAHSVNDSGWVFNLLLLWRFIFMSLTAKEKASVIEDYRLSGNDTGSPEVQVALLTARINKLTDHFKNHIHDFHSRRGLLRMVNLRRGVLKYLKAHDLERYRNLISRLGLRA
jgi:small subunit ribosomal protein S15